MISNRRICCSNRVKVNLRALDIGIRYQYSDLDACDGVGREKGVLGSAEIVFDPEADGTLRLVADKNIPCKVVV